MSRDSRFVVRDSCRVAKFLVPCGAGFSPSDACRNDWLFVGLRGQARLRLSSTRDPAIRCGKSWRMKKIWPLFLSAVLLASCIKAPQESTTSTSGSAQTPAASASGPVRIGFSMDTLKEERWQRDKQLVEEAAKKAGAILDVQVANGDDAVQRDQSENMLAKGDQVLIVAPHNGEIAASI